MKTKPPQVHWEPNPTRVPWILWGVLLVVAGIIGMGELYWIKRAHRDSTPPLPVLTTVPDFSFTTETGATITKKSLLGKIWIADFIFTRCAGPCPLMTEKMRQIQTASRNLDRGNIQLLSVTVDPTYDTPEVLARYGGKIGSNPDHWSFATGEPEKIEQFITKGMLLGLSKDGEGMPVHAQKFVVVDREGYVRAYHDLGDAAVLQDVIADIDKLSREKHTPRKKKP
ncbi:MAG: SCO family protein [Chthoniobacterales bacterium]